MYCIFFIQLIWNVYHNECQFLQISYMKENETQEGTSEISWVEQ